MGRRPRWDAAKLITMIVALVIIVIIMLMPGTQAWLRALLEPPSIANFGPETSHYDLERRLVIDANGGTVRNGTIDIFQPVEMRSGASSLQMVEYSSDPVIYSLLDLNGTSIMRFDSGQISGGQRYTVTLTYNITEQRKIWNIAQNDAGSIASIPEGLKLRYLQDEWKIIKSDDGIISLANRIRGSETNALAVISAIYDWMVANVEYPLTALGGEPKSSLQTLNDKVGDCDDQSILFCALARSVGIPAWLQLGSLYDPSQGTLGGHGWVQCYVPFASGGGVNVTIDLVNRQFLVWTPYHILDYTDNGNADDLKAYYHIFYCAYDPTTYSPGEYPTMTDDYSIISYQGS
jgi:hypothetical protein